LEIVLEWYVCQIYQLCSRSPMPQWWGNDRRDLCLYFRSLSLAEIHELMDARDALQH
jgi:hypothetical protein